MQTWRYMLKRILLAVISIFAIITITYFLMNLMPGDPFMSEKASEENRAILIAKYGLDQPVYVQYGKYLENLLHGDMGTSYVLQKGRAVKDIIAESFTVSMGLGVRALILAVICGIILGCVAGLCKDKLPDAIIRVLSPIGISMPGYVIASALMMILAVNCRILPVNYNKPGGWIMPMITLAIYPTSYLTRLTSQYPGSYEPGLLKNRAGEGYVRVCRSVYTCTEKLPDPGDYLSGTTDCIDSDRRICGGECIQCTWAGTLFCKFHQQPGLHDDYGRHHFLFVADRYYESGMRYSV